MEKGWLLSDHQATELIGQSRELASKENRGGEGNAPEQNPGEVQSTLGTARLRRSASSRRAEVQRDTSMEYEYRI
jgi:hypothetical protein